MRMGRAAQISKDKAKTEGKMEDVEAAVRKALHPEKQIQDGCILHLKEHKEQIRGHLDNRRENIDEDDLTQQKLKAATKPKAIELRPPSHTKTEQGSSITRGLECGGDTTDSEELSEAMVEKRNGREHKYQVVSEADPRNYLKDEDTGDKGPIFKEQIRRPRTMSHRDYDNIPEEPMHGKVLNTSLLNDGDDAAREKGDMKENN